MIKSNNFINVKSKKSVELESRVKRSKSMSCTPVKQEKNNGVIEPLGMSRSYSVSMDKIPEIIKEEEMTDNDLDELQNMDYSSDSDELNGSISSLYQSSKYIQRLNRSNKSQSIQVLTKIEKYQVPRMKSKDHDLVDRLKILYINNIMTFKNNIRKGNVFYLDKHHEKFNSHLTDSQFYIFNSILGRNSADLIGYIKNIYNTIKKNNGFCFKSSQSILTPILFDFLLVIDYKIDMKYQPINKYSDFLFYPNNTYLSVLPIKKYDEVKLYPLTTNDGLVLLLDRIPSNITLNQDEIITLFEDGKFHKIINYNKELHTVDVFILTISDFMMIHW
jgi:hypothetical protein